MKAKARGSVLVTLALEFIAFVATGCSANLADHRTSTKKSTSHKTMVWLATESPIDREGKKRPQTDYMELFAENSRWPAGEKALDAFVISQQFVLAASENQLHQIVTALHERNIALVMGGLMLSVGSNGCGNRGTVEGYSSPEVVGKAVKRLKELGADLRYIAMDEPLWFGHDYTGPNACRNSIDEVAKQVAASVAAARQVSPDIQVGDTEPINGSRNDWTSQVERWGNAYHAEVGDPLAFLITDIAWSTDWNQQFTDTIRLLERMNVPIGVIYNGDDEDNSDLAWTTHAESRIRTIESSLGVKPRIAMIDSWTVYPIHMLPEDQPGTLTNLLRTYVVADEKNR